MDRTANHPGSASSGYARDIDLKAPLAGRVDQELSPKLPTLPTEDLAFETLKDSPLADHLKASDPLYRVLCDAWRELAKDPIHFTLPMARLRKLCVEGMSYNEISKKENPPVKIVTLHPQTCKAARDLLESVGLKGGRNVVSHLTAQLKQGAFELNFQPWLCWFKQWREDPCGVVAPPPVSGLISREVFERLELGESHIGKGVSGIKRPTRSPDGRNREFTAAPFIKDGFFGVEVRPDPASFSDCEALMPRTRLLVLGYHERLMLEKESSELLKQRMPAHFPDVSSDRIPVRHLEILPSCRTPKGELLVTGTGALESLRRGIGPFDLCQLQAPREIKLQERGASLDCFPFARGAKHFAEALRLPKEQLQALGITHATFVFEKSDLAVLREDGLLSFTVLGYKRCPSDQSSLVPVSPIGRAITRQEDGKLRVFFDPSPALIDTASHWYRSEILAPRLEQVLSTGKGDIPEIGNRQVTRSGNSGPKFHMLDKDFCLPVTFKGKDVFVIGEVLPATDGKAALFQLTAFADQSRQQPVARWTAEVGFTGRTRSWTKFTEAATTLFQDSQS